jgi:hypothetical protein
MRSSLDAQTGLSLFLAFYKLLVRRYGGATGFLLRVYSVYRCLRYSYRLWPCRLCLFLLAVYYPIYPPSLLPPLPPHARHDKKEDH